MGGTGKSAHYVDVYLDVLHDPGTSTLLPRSDLKQGMLARVHWDSQRSGIRIPDEVAAALEAAWAHCWGTLPTRVPAANTAAIEGLVTEMRTYARSRSRRLRDQALREAHGVCCVCEVDFSQLLDGDGARALQVHHRAQLAAHDAPRLTRLTDLAVVCATCHAWLHMDSRRALSIEALKARLAKSV